MMHDHDENQLARIDREIIDALDVTASPELLPRIREQLGRTDDPRTMTHLLPMAAGALGLVVVVTFAVFYLLPGERTVKVASLPQPIVASTRVLPAQAPAIALRASAPAPVPTRPAEALGLRPSSDRAAIDRFVAALWQGTAVVDSIVDSPPDGSPIMELAIMPLTVPALSEIQ